MWQGEPLQAKEGKGKLVMEMRDLYYEGVGTSLHYFKECVLGAGLLSAVRVCLGTVKESEMP